MPAANNEEALANCIRQVALSTAQIVLDHSRSADRDAPENIHKIRISLKQLRASWQLLRAAVQRPDYRSATKRLRDAGRLLSPTRDKSVVNQYLVEYVEIPDGDGVEPATTFLDWERINTHIRTEVEVWQTLTVEFKDRKLVSKGVRHTYRRARKLGRAACKTSAKAEQRHNWRKSVKYLYYQLALLQKCGTKVQMRTYTLLDLLGAALGREHDLEVVQRHVVTGTWPDTNKIVNKAENEKQRIRGQTRDLYLDIFGKKPRKFSYVIMRAAKD